MSSATICVFDPTAPERSVAQRQRRVLTSLAGKVVGFIDNSKPNFHYLVDDLCELLTSRCGVKSVVKHSKHVACVPASEETMQDLLARCDLVIAGSGD